MFKTFAWTISIFCVLGLVAFGTRYLPKKDTTITPMVNVGAGDVVEDVVAEDAKPVVLKEVPLVMDGKTLTKGEYDAKKATLLTKFDAYLVDPVKNAVSYDEQKEIIDMITIENTKRGGKWTDVFWNANACESTDENCSKDALLEIIKDIKSGK